MIRNNSISALAYQNNLSIGKSQKLKVVYKSKWKIGIILKSYNVKANFLTNNKNNKKNHNFNLN